MAEISITKLFDNGGVFVTFDLLTGEQYVPIKKIRLERRYEKTLIAGIPDKDSKFEDFLVIE